MWQKHERFNKKLNKCLLQNTVICIILAPFFILVYAVEDYFLNFC